jgi:hypothetical protein
VWLSRCGSSQLHTLNLGDNALSALPAGAWRAPQSPASHAVTKPEPVMMIGPPVETKLNRSLRVTRTSEESKDRGLAQQLPSYTFPILSMYAESLRPSARVRRHRRSRVPPAPSRPRTKRDLLPPGAHLISCHLVSSHLMLSHRIASRLISSYLGAQCALLPAEPLHARPRRARGAPCPRNALLQGLPPALPFTLPRPLPSPHAPPNVDVSGPVE